MPLSGQQIGEKEAVFSICYLLDSLNSIYSIRCSSVFPKTILLSVNCVSYHGLSLSSMMLIISLHTVEPILSPQCLFWILFRTLSFPQRFQMGVSPCIRDVHFFPEISCHSMDDVKHHRMFTSFEKIRINIIACFIRLQFT